MNVWKLFSDPAHWLHKSAVASLLLALIFVAYSNTFESPLVLDDFHSFVEEKAVHTDDISLGSLTSLWRTKFGWQRSVPMITLALDTYLGHGELLNYHITNLCIHILCAVAVAFLVYQLVDASRQATQAPSLLLSAHSRLDLSMLTAAIWALNPVQVNAVTYIVQRMASLQAMFFILSTACYIAARKNCPALDMSRRAINYFFLSLFFGLLAFLSKENSAMLPFMLLITEVWFFDSVLLRAALKWLKSRRWISAFLVAALCIALIYACIGIFPKIQDGYNIRSFSPMQRVLTEARIVPWYATLLLFPLPSRLSIEHDINISTSVLTPPTTMLSLCLILLSIWAIFAYRKKFQLITYGVLWFYVNLIIESSIIPLELIFEHRLYLPSVGLIMSTTILLMMFIGHFLQRSHQADYVTVARCTCIIVICGLTLLTFFRNEQWADAISINADSAAKAPQNPRAHANLAVAYAKAQDYANATREADKAITLGYDTGGSYFVAANVILTSLLQQNKTTEAIQRGEEILSHRPDRCSASGLTAFFLSLSEAYRRAGDLQDSFKNAFKAYDAAKQNGYNFYRIKRVEKQIERILSLSEDTRTDLDGDGLPDPGTLSVKAWLGKKFYANGESSTAERLLVEAIKEDPGDSQASSLLEHIHEESSTNQCQQAKASFETKYVHHPFSRFNFVMAAAYLIKKYQAPPQIIKIGDRLVDEALKIDVESADAHLLKGWYLYQRDLADMAVAEARHAIRLDPQHAKAWLGLGFFLFKADRPHEAKEAFEEALHLYPGNPQRDTIGGIVAQLELASKSLMTIPQNGG